MNVGVFSAFALKKTGRPTGEVVFWESQDKDANKTKAFNKNRWRLSRVVDLSALPGAASRRRDGPSEAELPARLAVVGCDACHGQAPQRQAAAMPGTTQRHAVRIVGLMGLISLSKGM